MPGEPSARKVVCELAQNSSNSLIGAGEITDIAVCGALMDLDYN